MHVGRKLGLLELWRDDDEDPTTDVIRLRGKLFDTAGSELPTLLIFDHEPEDDTVDAVLGPYEGIYVPDAETGGWRATFAIPKEDLPEAQDGWWHRAYLVTAQGRRKSFSRGPCKVYGQ